jgi:hypothetical protein
MFAVNGFEAFGLRSLSSFASACRAEARQFRSPFPKWSSAITTTLHPPPPSRNPSVAGWSNACTMSTSSSNSGITSPTRKPLDPIGKNRLGAALSKTCIDCFDAF